MNVLDLDQKALVRYGLFLAARTHEKTDKGLVSNGSETEVDAVVRLRGTIVRGAEKQVTPTRRLLCLGTLAAVLKRMGGAPRKKFMALLKAVVEEAVGNEERVSELLAGEDPELADWIESLQKALGQSLPKEAQQGSTSFKGDFEVIAAGEEIERAMAALKDAA